MSILLYQHQNIPESAKTGEFVVSETEEQQSFSLLVTRKSPHATDALHRFIEDLGRGVHFNTIVKPAPGRSIISQISDTDFIKVKGLFGLQREASGSFLVMPPEPRNPYRTYIEYHIHIDDELSLHAKAGRKKFRYSLRAEGAEREFDCQQRLAALGIGLEPLLGFRFRDSSGLAILDGNNDETGAVVFTWLPQAQSFAPDIYPLAAWNDNCLPTTVPLVTSSIDETAYFQLLQSIGSIYQDIGRTRRIATLNAGIFRHAGHLENFIRGEDGRTLMADTDTCLLGEELSPEQIGGLLLRDLSSDVLRMISTISQLHWNSVYLRFIDNGRFNPFLLYLTGFFETMIPANIIQDATTILLSHYTAWIKEFRTFLDQIALGYSQEWDGSAPHRTAYGSKWRRLHIFFAPHCMSAIYSLLAQVDSDKRIWKLPKRPIEQLFSAWLEGANHFVKTASQLET